MLYLSSFFADLSLGQVTLFYDMPRLPVLVVISEVQPLSSVFASTGRFFGEREPSIFQVRYQCFISRQPCSQRDTFGR